MTKRLEELSITDDFMFGAVMRDPRRCKPLLELILGVKIHHIEYPELQKAISERYDSCGEVIYIWAILKPQKERADEYENS